MGAPALAERVRGFVRQAVDVLPFPRRIDLSTLPFDERWVRAEKLSPDKKIAFVAGEVRGLLDLLGESVEEKVYTYSTEREGELVVSQREIEESQLPPVIKAYILNPPVGTRAYCDWPTYNPILELSTTDNQRTRYQGSSTQFAINLKLTSSDGNLFGVGVGGEARKRSHISYINIWISPSWTDAGIKNRDLWKTEAYQNYLGLAREGYVQDGFATARELVRFAHDVISARAQPPAPTPQAA